MKTKKKHSVMNFIALYINLLYTSCISHITVQKLGDTFQTTDF